jgi:four helix bundle protein
MVNKSRLKDLEDDEISLEISDKVWNLVIHRDNFSRNNIGGQLLRSIDSVGANISEGNGRGSKIDNARIVKIASGSLFETNYWLTISYCREPPATNYRQTTRTYGSCRRLGNAANGCKRRCRCSLFRC